MLELLKADSLFLDPDPIRIVEFFLMEKVFRIDYGLLSLRRVFEASERWNE